MITLSRIKNHVDLSLSEPFLMAEAPRDDIHFNNERDSETVRADIDVNALDALVAQTMAEHDRFATSMDAAMAVGLHQLLPITRREAADNRMWAWLGLIRYPEFVGWRWKPGKTGLRSAERFCGGSVRQTFARLWWASELTIDEDGDYALTEKLLNLGGFQDVYEAIFGRAFCQHRPALKAFTDILGELPEKTIRDSAKEFGYLLTTMVLEDMNEEDISGALKNIAAIVGGSRVAA